MKVIISRKGFDSSFGGVASPILEDNSFISLPIPGDSLMPYNAIHTDFANFPNLLSDLTKGKITGSEFVHFDPDLNPNNMFRKEGWLPSLGQTGSAQGHLEGQKVEKGDIFLFFGWFRQTIFENGHHKYLSGSPNIHAFFGYLQIGEILKLGSNPVESEIIKDYPWLEGHPHLYGERDKNNCIYIANKNLVIDGIETTLPGGMHFPKFSPELCLTLKDQPSRTLWQVPYWLKPPSDNNKLSYHTDPNRWSVDIYGNNILQTVAKGQEFVIELPDSNEFNQWLLDIIPKPEIKRKLKM